MADDGQLSSLAFPPPLLSCVLPSSELAFSLAFSPLIAKATRALAAPQPAGPLHLLRSSVERSGKARMELERRVVQVGDRVRERAQEVHQAWGRLVNDSMVKLSTAMAERVKRPQRLRVPHNPLRQYAFAAIIPGDSAAEVVITSGIFNFLSLYNTVLIVRLILTWFPNPPQAIAGPLSTICDPYLNLFRGIIPPIGGTIDLSPVLAFLVLSVFSNAASALPAEMPHSQLRKRQPLLERGLRLAQRKASNRPANDE